MDLAELAALFLRRLLDEGVPISSATAMASSYVTAQVFTSNRPTPREPWEEK